jgi:hypothetical protein
MIDSSAAFLSDVWLWALPQWGTKRPIRNTNGPGSGFKSARGPVNSETISGLTVRKAARVKLFERA